MNVVKIGRQAVSIADVTVVIGLVVLWVAGLLIWHHFVESSKYKPLQEAALPTKPFVPVSQTPVLTFLDIKEYALRIAYDASYGTLSYKVNKAVAAGDPTTISVENTRLVTGRQACEPTDAALQSLAVFRLDPTPDFGKQTSQYGVLKIADGEYMYPYPDRAPLVELDRATPACQDTTVEKAHYDQEESLMVGFGQLVEVAPPSQ